MHICTLRGLDFSSTFTSPRTIPHAADHALTMYGVLPPRFFPLLTAFPSIATTPPPALAAAIPATFLRQAAPAGLSFECANVQVCKPPAPVSGTSASIVELVLALDRCQLGVCTLAHLHTKGRSRAGTSVAANYAEAEEPESREDFIHKMKLAMKELAETRCWLRILGASGYIDAKRLEPLIAESLELTRMMGASVSTARSRMG